MGQRARAGAIETGYGSRYGNLWWSLPDKKAYMARGRHNQVIIVIPDEDVVAALTAASPDEYYLSGQTLIDYIVRSVRAHEDLQPDPSGKSHLDLALQSAATERPDAVEEPSPLAKEISGKSYDFDDNALRLKTLTLNLIGPNPTWSVSYEELQPTKPLETLAGRWACMACSQSAHRKRVNLSRRDGGSVRRASKRKVACSVSL